MTWEEAFWETARFSLTVFAWLALKSTALSRGRGRVLFLFYFLLSSFITTFTSNDVCILTLTPIVCYFAKATGVDPVPFLYAEYAAANTFGALLYTGNPTNIIVAQAYDMTFLGYSKYMTLPTLAAGAACAAALLLQFHARIPAAIPLPSVDAAAVLRDRPGALLGSANMLTCLGLLAAAPSLGWAMWAITLVCAGLQCAYNAWALRGSLLALRPALAECWTCGCEPAAQHRRQERKCSKEEGDDSRLAMSSIVERAVDVESPDDGVADGGGADGGGGAGEDAPTGRADKGTGGLRQSSPVLQHAPNGHGHGGADSGQPPGLHSKRRNPCGSPRPSEWVEASSGHGSGCHGGGELVGSEPVSHGSCGHASALVLEPPATSGAEIAGTAGAAGAGSTSTATAPVLAVELGLAAAGRMEVPTEAAAAPEPLVLGADSLHGRAPTFWGLLYDLPWEVVPFALGMFVLVEGLHVQGWLDVFGSGLGRASSSLPAAVFLMGSLSVALANTINNQPMTILLTRVALDARFVRHVGQGNTHKAALFALVLGSNIGAVFTLIGALAGILWRNIAGLHGLRVTYGQFAAACCPVGLAALIASLLTLWFEFAVFPHED